MLSKVSEFWSLSELLNKLGKFTRKNLNNSPSLNLKVTSGSSIFELFILNTNRWVYGEYIKHQFGIYRWKPKLYRAHAYKQVKSWNFSKCFSKNKWSIQQNLLWNGPLVIGMSSGGLYKSKKWALSPGLRARQPSHFPLKWAVKWPGHFSRKVRILSHKPNLSTQAWWHGIRILEQKIWLKTKLGLFPEPIFYFFNGE